MYCMCINVLMCTHVCPGADTCVEARGRDWLALCITLYISFKQGFLNES